MLTALRIINVIIWGALFLYMVPAAISAIRATHVRRGDPWRLGVAAVSLIIVLGNLRFLLAPDNTNLFIAVYELTALVGLYKIWLAYSYGRGPKL